jgi:hypothetical protein
MELNVGSIRRTKTKYDRSQGETKQISHKTGNSYNKVHGFPSLNARLSLGCCHGARVVKVGLDREAVSQLSGRMGGRVLVVRGWNEGINSYFRAEIKRRRSSSDEVVAEGVKVFATRVGVISAFPPLLIAAL